MAATTLTVPIVVVVNEMTSMEAEAATAKIKGYVATAYRTLAEVHERRGYLAMGYTSFADYLKVEFDMSRGHGYRLLHQAEVVKAIEAAAGLSPDGDVVPAVEITEATARKIHPHLGDVTGEIAARVDAGEDAVVVVPEVVSSRASSAARVTKPIEERCGSWVQRLNGLMMVGAKLSAEMEGLATDDPTSRMAMLLYGRMSERKFDGEIRQMLDAEAVRVVPRVQVDDAGDLAFFLTSTADIKAAKNDLVDDIAGMDDAGHAAMASLLDEAISTLTAIKAEAGRRVAMRDGVCTPEQAREITDEIKSHLDAIETEV